MKANVWNSIEKEPKSIRKGYMRIYSFKPTAPENNRDIVRERMYEFRSYAGARECDYYMDILKCDE